MTCSVDGCGGAVKSRGWCHRHYMRWWTNGTLEPRNPHAVLDPVARFWAKVEKGAGCWLWLGSKGPNGYGQFWLNGRDQRAHRVSYELAFGPIPDGREIDHLCHNRLCVNPVHLDAVTRAVNNARRVYVPKTHCRHGHALEGENLVEWHDRQHGVLRRACRSCKTSAKAAHRARRRSVSLAAPLQTARER